MARDDRTAFAEDISTVNKQREKAAQPSHTKDYQAYIDRFESHIPLEKDSHLYLYAVVRKDLEMPTGKLAAQAGHAYTDSLLHSSEISPERFTNYRTGNGGSKVTMRAKNAGALIRAYEEAIEIGLPATLIVDKHHVLPPHFNGEPIITALGIGPCTQSEVRDITKRFRCV